MTWSGATGSDPKISRDEFAGAAKVEKRANAHAASAELGSADAVHADIPIDMSAADIAFETSTTETPVQAIDGPVPLPPIAKPVMHRTREEVCDTLTKAAESNNLPVPFFISLLFQESRFDPGTVSSAGAQGVAQFMPETAASVGLENPFDPLEAIPASARLLRNLVAQFGNLGLAAAAYNAGPKRIQEWLQKKGKLPDETKDYVKTITGNPAETWTVASALPGQRLPRHAPCQESAGLYAWTGPETIPLPAPSPLTQHATVIAARVVTPARAKILASAQKFKIASAEALAAVAPAAAPAKNQPIRITKQGARITAVVNIVRPEPKAEAKLGPAKHEEIAKPAAAPAAKLEIQQLAARKHKSEQHKLDKVAAR
jgi:hypothetical protein